jgi:hypothetical protein
MKSDPTPKSDETVYDTYIRLHKHWTDRPGCDELRGALPTLVAADYICRTITKMTFRLENTLLQASSGR